MPYKDELIYSMVARYGVHFGITSPKQVLDDVYGNRKVIATVDLPNFLCAIANHLPNVSIQKLIYDHTMLPLYAPFVPESRRAKCITLMAGATEGAAHLSLGLAASRVKQPAYLRYCPQCLLNQYRQLGEYYWSRLWQVPGANCCLKHGELVAADLERHSTHRHQFFDASPNSCPIRPQRACERSSEQVSRQVVLLLNRSAVESADYSQWTNYYRRLAERSDCCKGRYCNYEKIKTFILGRWPAKWLDSHGLSVTDEQSCWLRAIFRKHRKSFSYLEHIVACEAFLPDGWRIDKVIDDVAKSPRSHSVKSSSCLPATEAQIAIYRQHWLKILKAWGAKKARTAQGGGAAYAWLYKHDRHWLLENNARYTKRRSPSVNRVDWLARDRTLVKSLLRICLQHISDTNLPRMSRNWYLSQLDIPSTIEKKLSKLPLCRQFFDYYCETIEEYQVRRIAAVFSTARVKGKDIKRWQVLRQAGLSDERLTAGARYVLNQVMESDVAEVQNQIH